MFSLIITILSIALVAALAVTTIYYGGAAFAKSSAKATADTILQHAEMITSANTLYYVDHNGVYAPGGSTTNLGVEGLKEAGYLSAVPALPAGVTDETLLAGSNNLVVDFTDKNVCIELSKLPPNPFVVLFPSPCDDSGSYSFYYSKG